MEFGVQTQVNRKSPKDNLDMNLCGHCEKITQN